ncbi:amino acid-binding protein [Clostridia bacterium]|nr:amino acid-binding protein [Clostridia bacterium]
MNLRKKILAWGLFAVSLVTSLSGCSGTTATSIDSNGVSITETKTFHIGSFGPLTGGAASYGVSIKQGEQLAVDEINKAGGIQVGDEIYTLQLTFVDDQAKEDIAINAYNSLLDKKVNAVLGGATSGSTLAVAELIGKDNIFQLTPTATALNCIPYANQFRLCFTDLAQGELLVKYVQEKKISKVGMIYNHADEYSQGIVDAFINKIKGSNIQVVAKESFQTDDVDFSAQLTKIKNANPEIIIAPVYYEVAAYLLPQANAAGMKIPFLGSDAWDGVLEQLSDASVADGAVFLSPFVNSAPEVKKFVDDYQAAYQSLPDQFAADGYDSVYVLKEALEQAKSIKTEDLVRVMTQIEVAGMTGMIRFDENGECKKEAKFVALEKGKYVERKAETTAAN